MVEMRRDGIFNVQFSWLMIRSPVRQAAMFRPTPVNIQYMERLVLSSIAPLTDANIPRILPSHYSSMRASSTTGCFGACCGADGKVS
jgi:hypothetical protein